MVRTTSLALLVLTATGVAAAQDGPIWLPHVPFVATSPEVANAMLTIAGVKPTDIVYDLGCGDGRIVVMAASQFGARGTGIDIDARRVQEANENARRAGVTGKVRFVQGDLFYADFHEATVVTMFLLPSINVKLRPKLFRELKPGTRLVTHSFDIGDWEPDRRLVVGGVPVYLWRVPPTTRTAGRVGLEDGTPPPIPASIQMACDSRTSFEGYTDAMGNYRLALANGMARGGCRIRASLPGYRSDVTWLCEKMETIVLHRTTKAEGSLVSAGIQSAPEEAKGQYAKGRGALARGKPGEARAAFAQAVKIWPRFGAAWFELGSLEETRGRLSESAELYRKAIAIEPNYLSPYLGLVQVAVHQDRWQDLKVYAGKVIGLDAESFPDAYLYHAVGCLTLRDPAGAEKSARAAMKLDAEHEYPRAEYVLGLALAAQGNLAGARQHLAHYIEVDPKAPDLKEIKERIAVLEKAKRTAP